MKLSSLFLLLAILIGGCSIGEKTGPQIDEIKDENDRLKGNSNPATIELLNVAQWKGVFVKPVDVLFGYDNLIYVADEGANKVFQFDQNGKLLGESPTILNPTKLAMDRKLNLYVVGRVDASVRNKSVSPGSQFYAAAFYVLLNNPSGLLRQILTPQTVVQDTIVHPYYIPGFQGNPSEDIEFTGIATYGDNSFIIARRGFNNGLSTPPLGGWDNTIVRFDKNRKYTGYYDDLDPLGNSLESSNEITALVSYANPPQLAVTLPVKSFMVGLASDQVFIKVQNILITENEDGLFVDPDFSFLQTDTSKADRFLYDINKDPGSPSGFSSRFRYPADIAVLQDENQGYVIVDSELDSLYFFSPEGYEGVPVFGSKNVNVSFGGTGGGARQFNNPQGVSYGNQKIYVADTGNRRIMVFKLSTDITQ